MRRQSLADLHNPLARVSLHGQRPPPQDTPLFTPEYKPLLKGKAHQGFGMRVCRGHVAAVLVEHGGKVFRVGQTGGMPDVASQCQCLLAALLGLVSIA